MCTSKICNFWIFDQIFFTWTLATSVTKLIYKTIVCLIIFSNFYCFFFRACQSWENSVYLLAWEFSFSIHSPLHSLLGKLWMFYSLAEMPLGFQIWVGIIYPLVVIWLTNWSPKFLPTHYSIVSIKNIDILPFRQY